MKKRILFLFAALIILLGCSKDANQTTVKLIAMTVDSSYKTSDADHWVILHSETGDLIDYKSFESNDILNFQTTKVFSGSTIGITILKHQLQNGQHYYVLESYLGIEKGQDWTLQNKSDIKTHTAAGSFKVNIANTPSDVDQVSFTNKLGQSCGGSTNYGTTNLECGIYNDISKYIFELSDKSENLKYKTLQDVKDQSTYNLSFNDFKNFDRIVNFTFAGSSNVLLLIYGREADQSYQEQGYLINYHYLNDIHTNIKAGYLNELSKYQTYLRVDYPAYSLLYEMIGQVANENIAWPISSDFPLNSTSINSFSSSPKGSITFRSSYWQLEDLSGPTKSRVSWNVYSPNATHTIKEIPAELLIAHPALAFDKLKHSSTLFKTKSKSYSRFVAEKFQSLTPEDIQESISIFIY